MAIPVGGVFPRHIIKYSHLSTGIPVADLALQRELKNLYERRVYGGPRRLSSREHEYVWTLPGEPVERIESAFRPSLSPHATGHRDPFKTGGIYDCIVESATEWAVIDIRNPGLRNKPPVYKGSQNWINVHYGEGWEYVNIDNGEEDPIKVSLGVGQK